MVRHVEKVSFRALAFRDVERARQYADNCIGLIAQRRFRGQEDAPAVAGRDLLLEEGQGLAGFEDLAVERAAASAVLLAEWHIQILADEIAAPRQRVLMRVDEHKASVAVGGADHGRYRIDDLSQ